MNSLYSKTIVHSNNYIATDYCDIIHKTKGLNMTTATATYENVFKHSLEWLAFGLITAGLVFGSTYIGAGFAMALGMIG